MLLFDIPKYSHSAKSVLTGVKGLPDNWFPSYLAGIGWVVESLSLGLARASCDKGGNPKSAVAV